MSKFLMLPRESGEAFADLSPEEMQRIIQRYHAWTEELRAADRLLLGHKLHDGEGRVATGGADGMVVSDGPYSETKEVIGGFWLIEADDYDHALRLAADCPHLEYGSLEIRQIQEL